MSPNSQRLEFIQIQHLFQNIVLVLQFTAIQQSGTSHVHHNHHVCIHSFIRSLLQLGIGSESSQVFTPSQHQGALYLYFYRPRLYLCINCRTDEGLIEKKKNQTFALKQQLNTAVRLRAHLKAANAFECQLAKPTQKSPRGATKLCTARGDFFKGLVDNSLIMSH